jgi:hypothetical protein
MNKSVGLFIIRVCILTTIWRTSATEGYEKLKELLDQEDGKALSLR